MNPEIIKLRIHLEILVQTADELEAQIKEDKEILDALMSEIAQTKLQIKEALEQ